MIKFPNSQANTNNSIWCATNWAGFSEDDIGQVIATLNDVSNFSKLSDRMQQGFVNMIYLGRAMLNPGGFDTDPAFQVDPDGGGSGKPGGPVLDPAQGLYWEGISQGAIMGGALTALEPDLTQSVLDVTGMNYSTLLRRSADSAQYLDTARTSVSRPTTRTSSERPLLLSLMQLLWDRGEADGYAQHMTTDPLPNTPAHHVLLQLAYGDHQVSNLAGGDGGADDRCAGGDARARSGASLGREPVPRASRRSRPIRTAGSAAMVYYDGGPTRIRRHTGRLHGRDTGTRSTGPLRRRWWSCRPTRSASTAATRTPTRAGRWTASRRRPTGCSRAGSSTSADRRGRARPCYSNGYTGPGP